MILQSFKRKVLEEAKDQVKADIRSGLIVESHDLFSAADLSFIMEEIDIEDYSELVEDFEEISLDHDLLEDTEDLHEAYEFVPFNLGVKMDIHAEINLNEVALNVALLNQLKDSMFAEDYELTIDEALNRAMVVFRRAAGEITKIKKCGPGMKLSGNRCIPQLGDQKAKERMHGIKLVRAKRAMGTGKKRKAAIKAKITKRRVTGRNRGLSGKFGQGEE